MDIFERKYYTDVSAGIHKCTEAVSMVTTNKVPAVYSRDLSELSHEERTETPLIQADTQTECRLPSEKASRGRTVCSGPWTVGAKVNNIWLTHRFVYSMSDLSTSLMSLYSHSVSKMLLLLIEIMDKTILIRPKLYETGTFL